MRSLSPPHAASSLKTDEGGFALLLTLLVILLLTVLIFEMDFQARADLRSAQNFRDDFAAYLLATSAIDVAKQVLEEDTKNDTKNSSLIDGPPELWTTPIENYPVQDGTLSGRITDEAGKININMLVKKQNIEPVPTEWRINQLKRLFARLEVNPERVDAIVDWVDPNNETRSYGAEDDFYEYLDPPYKARNGPMETLNELLFIKDMSREDYKKIVPYLTVYTNATNGQINVNTADPLVLQSLHTFLTEDDVNTIVASRPYAKINDVNKLNNLMSANTPDYIPSALLTVQSNIFFIEVTGALYNSKKTIRAVWDRKGPKLLNFQVE